jgi:small subunit ribosomal protein S24e
VDIHHPNKANVSKAELREILSKKFAVKDDNTIYCFGFKTQFGGGKSTGFALIYDNLQEALATEPAYRLVRQGLKEQKGGSRKQRRELKNRVLKVRGTAKAKVGGKK